MPSSGQVRLARLARKFVSVPLLLPVSYLQNSCSVFYLQLKLRQASFLPLKKNAKFPFRTPERTTSPFYWNECWCSTRAPAHSADPKCISFMLSSMSIKNIRCQIMCSKCRLHLLNKTGNRILSMFWYSELLPVTLVSLWLQNICGYHQLSMAAVVLHCTSAIGLVYQ